MDFDTLDRRMRGFEQSLDRTMLQGVYIVARLDGHGFTRLTKKEWDLERPFDIRFRNIMVETLRHLMDCGFRIIYGYTQSDEISLLFHLEDQKLLTTSIPILVRRIVWRIAGICFIFAIQIEQ